MACEPSSNFDVFSSNFSSFPHHDNGHKTRMQQEKDRAYFYFREETFSLQIYYIPGPELCTEDIETRKTSPGSPDMLAHA
jgi:hypothetical protein